jgi:hypothetical protein
MNAWDRTAFASAAPKRKIFKQGMTKGEIGHILYREDWALSRKPVLHERE